MVTVFINLMYIREAVLPLLQHLQVARITLLVILQQPPSGWSTTIPAYDGNPVYASSTIASVSGATGTDNSLTWSSPVKIAENGKLTVSTVLMVLMAIVWPC